jgi:hypothetical protein
MELTVLTSLTGGGQVGRRGQARQETIMAEEARRSAMSLPQGARYVALSW